MVVVVVVVAVVAAAVATFAYAASCAHVRVAIAFDMGDVCKGLALACMGLVGPMLLNISLSNSPSSVEPGIDASSERQCVSSLAFSAR